MPLHFLGYPTLTEWRAAIDPRQPVNALSVIESSPAGHLGLGQHKHHIVLSQVQGATVHYLRLLTAGYQSFYGQDTGDYLKHEAKAESAWAILQRWLAEDGLTVRRALLAFPKNLRLLDGSAGELMDYRKDLGGWIRTDRIDPELLEPYQPAGLPVVVQAA